MFTTHPNFNTVLNWSECDTSVQLLFFEPSIACIISSLPSQSIIGYYDIVVTFSDTLVRTFRFYRFVPSLAGEGNYRVIVKHNCICSGQIKVGIVIHDCSWDPDGDGIPG